jgi:hypothetical protein
MLDKLSDKHIDMEKLTFNDDAVIKEFRERIKPNKVNEEELSKYVYTYNKLSMLKLCLLFIVFEICLSFEFFSYFFLPQQIN